MPVSGSIGAVFGVDIGSFLHAPLEILKHAVGFGLHRQRVTVSGSKSSSIASHIGITVSLERFPTDAGSILRRKTATLIWIAPRVQAAPSMRAMLCFGGTATALHGLIPLSMAMVA